MIDKEVFLTKEGLEKTENELDQLKSVRRREIAEKIKEALAFGDLSENSEYDEAKNEQAWVEERIGKLENTLRNAVVISDEDISLDSVSVGTKVTLKDMEYDEEVEYSIVGSAEADPYEGRISNESPVGSTLIGSKVGDIVSIQVPDGTMKYEVLAISR